jgi:hypothetical protein
MLFDCRDALKRMVDLFPVASNIVELLLDRLELAVDVDVELVDLHVDPRDVVLGGHRSLDVGYFLLDSADRFDDMREHEAIFVEGRLLGGHAESIAQVMIGAPSAELQRLQTRR